MRFSGPLAWIAGLGVLVGVLGSGLTLASKTFGLSGESPPFVSAAMATMAVVVVATLVALLVGLRGDHEVSTEYW
jgi:hypothetical protein